MSTAPLSSSRPTTTYSGGNSRGLHPNYYLEDVFIEVRTLGLQAFGYTS
jgi:hypothetical protein